VIAKRKGVAARQGLKEVWRETTRTSGPQGHNLIEPPGADPHAGWCGRGAWATTPPISI
jgi:hypothetical protein